MDFTTFAITGPYGVATDTTSTKTVYGAAVKDDAPNAVASNMLWTQCKLSKWIKNENKSIFYNLILLIDLITHIAFSYLVLGNTDSFTISGSSGSNPPVICGTNTGEHSMYMGYIRIC